MFGCGGNHPLVWWLLAIFASVRSRSIFAALLVFMLVAQVKSSAVTITTDRSKGKFKFSNFPDPLPQGNATMITLPIKRAGNLLLVEVKIDTMVGNLILDTGAPHLVLNKTYFRHYPGYGEVTAGGITGSAGSGMQTVVQKLDFGNELYFSKVDADMVPLGHLESKKGIKILGLLGLNLLKHLDVIIDFREGRLILFRCNRGGQRTGNDTLGPAVSEATVLRLAAHPSIMLVSGLIAGKHLKFCIDTGAETNVLSSSLSKKVLSEFVLERRMKLSGSGSIQKEVLYGRINSLTIGGKEYGFTPTTLVNLSQMSMSYECIIDGMLGIDFLSQHTVGFNLCKGEVYLW